MRETCYSIIIKIQFLHIYKNVFFFVMAGIIWTIYFKCYHLKQYDINFLQRNVDSYIGNIRNVTGTNRKYYNSMLIYNSNVSKLFSQCSIFCCHDDKIYRVTSLCDCCIIYHSLYLKQLSNNLVWRRESVIRETKMTLRFSPGKTGFITYRHSFAYLTFIFE